MRRRAGAAMTGLRRRLSSSGPASPGVPFFINLLPDAELWPKTGRVGEQRLLLVQYWRQMQREMTKESAESVEPQAAAVDTTPAEPSIPASPSPSASGAAIPLGQSKGIPTYEELSDDADDYVEVAAMPEPEPAAAPEPPPAAAPAPAVLGARDSWVPASVLFAKQPEEARTTGPGPDELTEVAQAPAAPLLLGAESVPQAQAPAAAEDPSQAPLVADEPPQRADVESASEPMAADVADPPLAADPPPEIQPIVAEAPPAVPSIVPDAPSVGLLAPVEPAVAQSAEDAVASADSEVALPLIEMPVAPTDVVPDLEADEVVEIAFAEPTVAEAASLPELPALDEEIAIDAPRSMSLEVPETSLPRLEVAGMADRLVTDRGSEALGELPIDHGPDRLAAWSVELFVETPLQAASAGGTPDPGPAARQMKDLAVDELVARAGDAITLDVPVPTVELAPPDVDTAMFVDEPAPEVPEAPPATLARRSLEEMPSFIAEAVGALATEVPAAVDVVPGPDQTRLDLLSAIGERAAELVGAIEDVRVDLPIPDVGVEADLAVAVSLAPEQVAETSDDIKLPEPPSTSAFDVSVLGGARVDEPAPTPHVSLEPAEALAADPAFAESMAAGVDEASADGLADGVGGTDPRHMPALEADPMWQDAVAEWTSEARDTRLRRAGIIPMPATKPAAVAEASGRAALPALERFLRSAQARRRKVDESVA